MSVTRYPVFAQCAPVAARDVQRLKIIDVGANPIDGAPPYRTLLDQNRANVIGFEPDAYALAVTRSSRSFQYIDDLGAYGQVKYSTASGHNVHLGTRLDRNSLIGSSLLSLRGGYAGTFGPLTAKALFSQAVNAPGPFDVIYAGQTSSAAVKPERVRTLTGHLSAAFSHIAFLSDLFLIDSRDVLLQGINLRRRVTLGTDLGLQAAVSSFRAWGYYSHLFLARRTRGDGDELLPEGDLAAHKAWGGLSYGFSPVTATVIGRLVGERRTVETNPIPSVPAFESLPVAAMFWRNEA